MIGDYLLQQLQAIEAEQRRQESIRQLALRVGQAGGRDRANAILTDLSAGLIDSEEAIRELMTLLKELAGAGRRGDQPLQVNLHLDGRQFATVATPYISGEMNATIASTMGGA